MKQRKLGEIVHDFGQYAEGVIDEWLDARHQIAKREAIRRYLGNELEDLRRRLAQHLAHVAIESHTPCPPCPPCPFTAQPRLCTLQAMD